MSGNKASCYFLTAVQTCIDRNLAPRIKMRLWVADVKPTGHYCPCAHLCVRVQHFPLCGTWTSLEKPLEEASLCWRKKHLFVISTRALTASLTVTMGNIEHSDSLSRFAGTVQSVSLEWRATLRTSLIWNRCIFCPPSNVKNSFLSYSSSCLHSAQPWVSCLPLRIIFSFFYCENWRKHYSAD